MQYTVKQTPKFVRAFVLLAALPSLAAGCVGKIGVRSGGTGANMGSPGSSGTGGSGVSNPGTGNTGTGNTGTGNTGAGGSGTSTPGTGGTSTATGTGGSGSVAALQPFACDTAATPASMPLPRLSVAQFNNTIHDIVKVALKGDEAMTQSVLSGSAVQAALSNYPPDDHPKTPQDRFGGFRRLDQALQDGHVRASYEMAVALGAQLTSSALLGRVVGSCATDSDTANDESCISSFIKTFGARALRRPLADDEVTFYRGFYGTSSAITPAAFADLIAGFLTAPQFLYLVEHGDQAVAGKNNVFSLSAWEVASRLSYQFIQSMPDDELVAAATNGTLVSDANVYRAQIDRLLADPRAQTAFDEFFTDYFKLFRSDIHNVTSLDAKINDPVFKAFAGNNLPGATMGDSMLNDALDLARYFTFKTAGTYTDLLTSNLSFARTSELARLYGVTAWDGTSTPPSFPAGQRPGFLTRAAFLSTGNVTTRPIMKGVFIRKFVLCDEIPDPPANASNTPIDTTNHSARQAVEAITEQAGTSCALCHKEKLNPLGFATENFDALGRLRTDEPIFDATGKVTTRIAVNTTTAPHVTPSDTQVTNNAAEMIAALNASGKAQACFARNYFRFTFRRFEDTTVDGCALERTRQALMTGSLKDAFRDLIVSDQFRTRNFQ